MKNKKFYILSAIILCLTLFVPLKTVNAAELPNGVTSEYKLAAGDDFEAKNGKGMDYIYKNTAMLFCEGLAADEANNIYIGQIITDNNKLNGSASFLWTPGGGDSEGWIANNKVFGISDTKTDISGGGRAKLTFNFKSNDMEYLVVKAATAASGVYQEYVVDCIKKERETVNISQNFSNDPNNTHEVKVVKDDGGNYKYMSVTFEFETKISNKTYIQFVAKSTSANANAVFDDIMLNLEEYSMPYYNYDNYSTTDFENINSLNQLSANTIFSMDTGANTSLSEVLVAGAINGKRSIKIVRDTTKSKYILTTKPNNLTIKDNYYKLYLSFIPQGISQIYFEVVDSATDVVYYDLAFDINKRERTGSVGSPLFDSSSMSVNSKGVWTVYGEFKAKTDVNSYIRIKTDTNSTVNSLILDNFNLLQRYEKAAPNNTTPQNSEKYSGKVSATAMTESQKNSGSLNIAGIIKTVGIFGGGLGLIVLTVIFIQLPKAKKYRIVKGAVCFMLIMTITAFAACGKKSGGLANEDYLNTNYTTVTPEKVTGKLNNPGMGWVLLEEPTYGGHMDLGTSGEFPEIDNVSLSTSWAHIETEEGVYDFTYLDQVIDYWSALGKHINFRICTDSLMLTYTYSGVPEWLINKYNLGYEICSYTDPGPVQKYKALDLTDKNYLINLDKFLNAVAEKYKDNKMVDVVEIRGFGNWGEWHSGHSYETDNERINSLRNIIQKYDTAFAKHGKLLAVSCSWDPNIVNSYGVNGSIERYEKFYELSAFDYAWRLENVTFRRDGAGSALRDDLDNRLMAEAFRSGKRVPMLGEYATNYAALKNSSNTYDLTDAINEILYKMRANYSTVLGWVASEFANIIEAGDTDFIDRANELFGYRLEIESARFPKQVSAGGKMNIMTQFSNSAVGRFWYKYPLGLYLLDSNNNIVASKVNYDFDARTFVQGEINNIYSSFDIPSNVSDGNYKLAAAILNDEGNPSIELGSAGQIDDTKMYELGSVEVKSDVKNKDEVAVKYSYSQKDEVSLKANTTYMISLEYKPSFDLNKYYFGNNDAYVFQLKSSDGEICGQNKWQDVSNEYGTKTFIVTTGDKKDYKPEIYADSFGRIAIGDMYIEEVSGTREDFELGDYLLNTSSKFVTFGSSTAKTITSSDGLISGSQSINLSIKSSAGRGHHYAMVSDSKNLNLKADTTYTVSYDFRALGEVGKGGYYFVDLLDGYTYGMKPSEAAKLKSYTIGEWYERSDNYDTRKSFTFNTNGFANPSIAFGVQNSGSYIIDNFVIIEYVKSEKIAGKDLGFQHNVKKTVNKGFGITEDFENKSFAASGFDWGKFAWGRMTSDSSKVISGTTSLWGKIEDTALFNEWFEFSKSKSEYYNFESGVTYTVTFKYKILNYGTGGNFYVIFRDETAGLTSDVVNDSFAKGKTLNQVYAFTQDFTLKDYNDYKFVFGLHNNCEVIVDEINIVKK